MGFRLAPSRIDEVVVAGRRILIKRDDLFHLSGNKVNSLQCRPLLTQLFQTRKLHWLMAKDHSYFHGREIVSYGGVQSNAMFAIAQLAQEKKAKFHYFSRPVPSYLRQNPRGNYQAALHLGMQHTELNSEQYESLTCTTHQIGTVQNLDQSIRNPLVIPQGVATQEAEIGLKVLAEEINEVVAGSSSKFVVIVPAGTGTTAFYLSQHLSEDAQVICVPCVGDGSYLRHQFDLLQQRQSSLTYSELPHILEMNKKVSFGKPWKPIIDMYQTLQSETCIEFDLLYGCYTWIVLLDHINAAMFRNKQILYVHSGGISGNITQIDRYIRKRMYQESFIQ